MTPQQKAWAESQHRLADAVVSLGFPAELAGLLAQQLGSPRAMDRMAAYLCHVRPKSMEMIVDEMLAICADRDKWRAKKESEAAQASYSAWLNSEERWQQSEDDEDG